MGSLSDRIREFVIDNYIKPELERGSKKIIVIASDVQKKMKQKNMISGNRVPAICSALRSDIMIRLIETRLHVKMEVNEIKKENVKRDSSTNIYVFQVKEGKETSISYQSIPMNQKYEKNEIEEWSYENEWFEENNVTKKIVDWLKDSGWRIIHFNKDKKKRGPDIIAIKNGRRMITEVKGYPSDKYVQGEKKGQKKPTPPKLQAKHWFADALLTIIRAKHSEPNTIMAIGLPRKQIYETLIEETMDILCRCMDLQFILVNEEGTIQKISCR